MVSQYATFAMAAILIVAMALEIRTGRLPNWLVVLPFVLFVGVLALADDRTALYWQIVLATCIFVLGLIMFAIGGLGAGAVKLVTGTVLFIPMQNASFALMVYLIVFFVSSFVFINLRKLVGSEDSSWHLMAHAVLPLSFSIGIAGLVGMFWL